MAKINFKRSGGIAGNEIDIDLDLNELPAGEMQALMALITESNFFNIPQNLIEHATTDDYEYTVTMDAGNTHHTIHTSDATAPASLRPLLDRLSTLAQVKR
jgi:hypothetical protein